MKTIINNFKHPLAQSTAKSLAKSLVKSLVIPLALLAFGWNQTAQAGCLDFVSACQLLNGTVAVPSDPQANVSRAAYRASARFASRFSEWTYDVASEVESVVDQDVEANASVETWNVGRYRRWSSGAAAQASVSAHSYNYYRETPIFVIWQKQSTGLDHEMTAQGFSVASAEALAKSVCEQERDFAMAYFGVCTPDDQHPPRVDTQRP